MSAARPAARLAPGTETWDQFGAPYRSRASVFYAYRHTDGRLFSTVAPTLTEARQLRDTWYAAHVDDTPRRTKATNGRPAAGMT